MIKSEHRRITKTTANALTKANTPRTKQAGLQQHDLCKQKHIQHKASKNHHCELRMKRTGQRTLPAIKISQSTIASLIWTMPENDKTMPSQRLASNTNKRTKAYKHTQIKVNYEQPRRSAKLSHHPVAQAAQNPIEQNREPKHEQTTIGHAKDTVTTNNTHL